MRILFIGDIVGKTGRMTLAENLDKLKSEYDPDLVVVNCENAAAGFGVTPKIVKHFFEIGCDVLTSGNHIWDRKEIIDFIDSEPRLIRPANFPSGTPGIGSTIVTAKDGSKVAVVNLMGQVFMSTLLECPFKSMDRLLEELHGQADIIFVDFHAEASSEKQALAHYLDGKVAAVVGTHTHVPTADERVFPRGTAYISDVGMTGCYDSVIGMNPVNSLKRFLNKMPQRLEVSEGPAQLQGVLVEAEQSTGLSSKIIRVRVDPTIN